jgi:DNA invertase Pin-like site-specific DNA recombinase
MASGVEIVAVNNPHANKLTVHILAAVAQHEREIISARTLAARKPAQGAANDWEAQSSPRPAGKYTARRPLGSRRASNSTMAFAMRLRLTLEGNC